MPSVIAVQPLYLSIDPISHGELCIWLGQNVAQGLVHGYRYTNNNYIDFARNQLCSIVLDEYPQATHLFFIDQDMLLPMDVLRALVEDDKDFVSAVYFGKDNAATLVGFKSLETGERLDTYDNTCVQEVPGFGMGAALIKTDLLRRMAAHFGDRQWFRSEEKGEDKHFCLRLQQMGVSCYLDGRVECGHVGTKIVTRVHWEAAKRLKEHHERETRVEPPQP